MQRNLFPGFAEDLGPTTDKHLSVIVALDMIEVEKFILYQSPFAVGRPPVNRDAMARAFVAKAVLNISTTVGLIDRLKSDSVLRRICGFDGKIPSEGKFSNAFAEFANQGLAQIMHEALVRETYREKIVGHVSRDSTAINAREKPAKSLIARLLLRRLYRRRKDDREKVKSEHQKIPHELNDSKR
jgi:hypothetical protein